MAKSDTSNAKNEPLGSNPDTLNPGDQYYREGLVGGNKEYDDAHGDRVQRNYNADKSSEVDGRKELDDKERTGDSLYKQGEREQNNSPSGRSSRATSLLKGKLRGKGPLGGIVALLLVLGGTGASFLGPASLLTNFSSILSNHMDFGNRLLGKTGKSYATAIFGNRNCSTATIKCKFTTVSEKRMDEWKKRGIEVKADKNAFGRYKVRGLVFPNGKEVNTKRAYNNLKFSDPYNYSKLQRFPIRATYLDTRSSINKSLKKFNVNLSDKFKSSNKKDKEEREKENNNNMDQKTDSEPDKDERIKKIKSTGKERISSATSSAKAKLSSFKESVKASNPAIGAGMLACTTLSVIKSTQAAIILLWHAELIKFMIPFIQAGSQAKEAGVNGEFDWETAEYYGDRLTYTVTQKEIDADPEDAITQDMLGKTAMDSAGFAAALNGDFGNYNPLYQGWGPASKVWGAGVIGEIEGYIKTAITTGSKIPGFPDIDPNKGISHSCKVLNYAAYAGLAGCFGPQALACFGTLILRFGVGALVGDEIVELVTGALSDEAMEMIAKADLTTNLTGPALGDAIVSGAGVLASYSDRASGLAVAGNSNQAFTAYRDLLHDVDFQESKIAKNQDLTSKNQFDVQNKYSFAGRVASAVSNVSWDGTLLSGIANTIGITSKLPSGASASAMKQGVYQPIEVLSSEEKFRGALKDCQSTGLTELGIPCIGESGRAIPIIGEVVDDCLDREATQESGTSCIERAIDYLSTKKYEDSEGNQISYIDNETGEPGGWSEYPSANEYNNPFLMFMKFCGNDRQYPLGYTDIPIEDGARDSADWHDGSACAYSGDKAKDNDLAWMSYYYTMCIAHYASDNDQEYCWKDVSPAAAVVPIGGEWTYPSSCQTSVSDRFGTRGGDHLGVDIAGPFGTPIYAARAGVVVASGPARGFGNWIVIQHDVDGKRVDTVYGHMKASDLMVKVGDTVQSGQEISKIASEGGSTGPHLHFEIWQGGRFGGAPVDPEPIINPYRKCI